VQSASGQALFWGVLPAWLGLAWLGLAWRTRAEDQGDLGLVKISGLKFFKEVAFALELDIAGAAGRGARMCACCAFGKARPVQQFIARFLGQ